MTKRFLMLSGALALVLIWVLATAAGPDQKVIPIPAEEMQTLNFQPDRADCNMYQPWGAYDGYYPSFEAGHRTVAYFNPADFCSDPVYPLEIERFGFTLRGDGSSVWPVTLDIIVYDASDSCNGPGAEIYRHVVYATESSYKFPNFGTREFNPGLPCCVDGPFFIGLEYLTGSAGTTPSICWGDQGPDTCVSWIDFWGSWAEFYDQWGSSPPGYPMFRVYTETDAFDCRSCEWNPGDSCKMHYPQLPDVSGWDVQAGYNILLADDFQCTESGFIQDIHFWGSWKDDVFGSIEYFELKIYTDIPADPPGVPYSRPGDLLWGAAMSIDDIEVIQFDSPTPEGWYNPAIGDTLQNNHWSYFQYNICLPEAQWFPQEQDSIYWLSIYPHLFWGEWGWKSSDYHFNDDAVWAYDDGTPYWVDMWEPYIPDPITNEFWIQLDGAGSPVPGATGGTDYYGTGDVNGWYFYPNYEWWNIWFYDHPFNPDRYKEISLSFNWVNTSPDYFIEVALNFARDTWEPFGPPPVPPLTEQEENMHIVRIPIPTPTPGLVEFEFTIPTYNPEWVSIDVRGYNFWIGNGEITHECLGPQSLNLAFVLDGAAASVDSGACCYPEPTGSGDWLCTVTDEVDCVVNLGGAWEGVGTTCQGMEACCLPNGDCVNADVLCCINELGGEPQSPGTVCTDPQACCLPNGDCVNADYLCCYNELGGIPQGAGTVCTEPEACCMPDGSCIWADAICCVNELGGTPQGAGSVCTDVEACCFPNNTCLMLDPLCCDDLGGTPQGAGSTCLGMEACCMPNGSCVMADAICCVNELGGIPQSPGTVCTDIQACCLPNGQCQMLDPLCCDDLGGIPQGAGTVCTIAEACCFPTSTCYMIDPLCCDDLGGTPQGAGSVCLGMQACCFPNGSCVVADAICCINELGGTPAPGQPTCLGDGNGNNIDDACEEQCDAIIGDANGSGGATPIDIDDVVYLIAYIFSSGTPPVPYPKASGDADRSCDVDIDDVVYLIAYIFSGGPPPCTCEEWVSACGALH